MPIPKGIERDHVIGALKEIDKSGVPDKYNAITTFLVYNGKRYPIKYTIHLAGKYTFGRPIPLADFNTHEAVRYLKKLGFKIERIKKEGTKTLEIRYWEKSQEDSGNEVGRENEEDIFLLKSLVLEKMVELALAYAKYNDKAGVIKVLEEFKEITSQYFSEVENAIKHVEALLKEDASIDTQTIQMLEVVLHRIRLEQKRKLIGKYWR